MQPGDNVTAPLAQSSYMCVCACVREAVDWSALFAFTVFTIRFSIVAQCCACCGCCTYCCWFCCHQFFLPNLQAQYLMLYAIVFQFTHCCCRLNDSKTARYVHNSYLRVCCFTVLAGQRVRSPWALAFN